MMKQTWSTTRDFLLWAMTMTILLSGAAAMAAQTSSSSSSEHTTTPSSTADSWNGPGNLRGRGNLCGHHGRRLPYDADMIDLDEMEMAEIAFLVGFLCAMALLCCLVCSCFGGAGRCSLWDCVALVCLWEMCCGGRNPNDFVMM